MPNCKIHKNQKLVNIIEPIHDDIYFDVCRECEAEEFGQHFILLNKGAAQ